MQHLATLDSSHLILRASDLEPDTVPSHAPLRATSRERPLLLIGDSDYKSVMALLPVLPSFTLLVVPLPHVDPAPQQQHTYARRAVCAGFMNPDARCALVDHGVTWLGERPGLAADYRLIEEGLVAVQTVVAA